MVPSKEVPVSTSTSVCYSDLLGQSVFDYLFSITTTAPPPRPQFHGGERYITHSHIPDTPGLRKGAQQKWQIKGLATPLASSAPPVMERRQARAPWPKTECLNGSTESSTRAPDELESESQTHPINTQNLAGFYKVTLQSMTKTTRTLKVQISLSFF